MIWMLWMPFFFTLPQLQQPQAAVLTAEQAVAIGLAQNFDIRIAQTDAEIAATNVGLGRADRLPSLDANASAAYNVEEQSTNSPFAFGDSDSRSFGLGVALNWRLFDGYRLVANERRYQHLSQLEQTQLYIDMEATIVAILAGYYDIVRLDALLDVAEASFEISKDRLEKLRIRRELGAVDQTELLDATVALNNDRSQKLNQELQRELAVQQLNLLMARSIETPISVATSMPELGAVPSSEALLTELLSENNSIRAARIHRKVAREDITIAKAVFLPKVDLNAGIDWSDARLDPAASDLQFGAIDTTTTNAGVRIGVTFNLFDGRRKQMQRATAEMALKRQELAIAALELNLSKQLQEKRYTYQQRQQLRDLEAANVGVAQENLDLTQEQYRLGSTSSLEFRDAQVNLTRARANLVNIEYLAYLASLDLDQLRGALLRK